MFATESILFILGAIFLLVGLLGGGLEVSEVRVPPLSVQMRFITASIGVAMFAGAIILLTSTDEAPVEATPIVKITETPVPTPTNTATTTSTVVPSPTGTTLPTLSSTPAPPTLTATSTLTPTTTPTRPIPTPDVQFSDDFSTANNAWDRGDVESENLLVSQNITIEETYRIEAIGLTDERDTHLVAIPGIAAKDFYLEFTAALVEATEDSGFHVVVQFRASDDALYQMRVDDDAYAFWAWTSASGWNQLIDWQKSNAFSLVPDKVNTFAISAIESDIVILANGEHLLTIVDTTVDSSGQFKLGVTTDGEGESVTVDFDDVIVGRPNRSSTMSNILFQDSFANSDSSLDWNLESFDSDNTTISRNFVDEQYQMSIEAKSDDYSWGSSFLPGLSVKDFLLQFEITLAEAPNEATPILDVDFRKSANALYRLKLRNNEYAFLVWTEADEWDWLIDWTQSNAFSLEAGVPNEIKISAVGKDIAVFVNDEQILTISDDTVGAGGQIRFFAGVTGEGQTASFAFDDVLVERASLFSANTQFQDDFSSSDFDWDIESFVNDKVDVSYELIDEQYRISVTTTSEDRWTGLAEIPGVLAKDFHLQLDATLVDASDDASPSFLIRFRDNSKIYHVEFNDDSYTFSTWTPETGWNQLVSQTKSNAFALQVGIPNHFEIIAVGSEIAVLANGIQIMTIVDDTISASGQIKLGVEANGGGETSIFDFDNVLIEPISESVINNTLFEDDFSAFEFDWNIEQFISEKVTISREFVAGRYRLTTATTGDDDQVGRAPIPGLSTEDFRLRFEATLAAATENAAPELNIKFRDSSDFQYHIEFSDDSYTFWVWTTEGGWRQLIDWTKSDAFDLEVGVTNHFEIVAVGSEIAVFANDEQVMTIIDDSVTTGGQIRFGIEAAGGNETSAIDIDNVFVEQAFVSPLGEVLFEEDFTTSTFDWNLESSDSETTTISREFIDDQYRISTTTKTTSGRVGLATIPGLAVQDFQLQFEASIAEFSDEIEPTIFIRFRDDDDGFYQIRLKEGHYDFQVRTQEDGWNQLVDWSNDGNISLLSGAPHLIAVTASGSDITVFVNDAQIMTISDTTISTGGQIKIGVSSRGEGQFVTVDFDNIFINR